MQEENGRGRMQEEDGGRRMQEEDAGGRLREEDAGGGWQEEDVSQVFRASLNPQLVQKSSMRWCRVDPTKFLYPSPKILPKRGDIWGPWLFALLSVFPVQFRQLGASISVTIKH